MTRGAWWVAALLWLQPSALAWQDGKPTFPETAPVPSEIAKLLEEKPRARMTYPLTFETNGIKVEAEPFVIGKPFEATITVTRDSVKTVIRNPRADQRLHTLGSTQCLCIGPDSEVVSLLFSPDQRTLYAGSRGGGLRVIDLARGKETGLLRDSSLTKHLQFGAHGGSVTRLWTI